MNITIPVRFSQVGSFLAGFLVAWCLFGNGPAKAEEKLDNATTQQEMVKRTYMMVHDLYVMQMFTTEITTARAKQLWLPIQFEPRKPAPNSPHF